MNSLFPGKLTLILSIMFAVVVVVVLTKTSAAETWSWTGGTPTLVSNKKIDGDTSWFYSCQARYKTHKEELTVDGNGTRTKYTTDCVIGERPNFKLLNYSSFLAVQFAGDKNAHAIRNLTCGQECIYLPSRDVLITISGPNNTISRGIVSIYKNFSTKLERKLDGVFGESYYELKQKTPDETIGGYEGTDGYIGYADHLQRSDNDRWVVLEFKDLGLFRRDMDNGELLKMNNWKIPFNASFYDLTNDGQRIVHTGVNVLDPAVYERIADCGLVMPKVLTKEAIERPVANPCAKFSLKSLSQEGNSPYIPAFEETHQPHFDADGGELSFVARKNDTDMEANYITLKASGYAGVQPLKYLALGDSYSSGEGDTQTNSFGQRYYRPFTNNNENFEAGIPKERCHVSTRSYPYRLAASMNLAANSWNSIACSGAEMEDIENGTNNYLGQWDRLKSYDTSTLKAVALNEFIPGRERQIEFVKKYKPEVITLTIGGNDVGFGEKVGICVIKTEICPYVNEKRGEIKKGIDDRFNELRSLYKALYEASGSNAKIYVFGYPQFVNGSENANCSLNTLNLYREERELIHNSIIYFNNVIEQAAKAAGVKYLDIEESLNGHKLCDDGEKYVTGVTDPLNWSDNQIESFHPNAKAHEAIAIYVKNQVNTNGISLIDYDICPYVSSNSCKDESATLDKVVVPDYFMNIDSNKNVRNKQMIPTVHRSGSSVGVTFETFTFNPFTPVSFVLHSDPTKLGDFSVNADGSLSADISIPSSIEPGFHTLVVSGQTYSGEPIEYEQTVLIESSNPNDIDGDGITDVDDKCYFVQASSKDEDKDGIDDACDAEIGVPIPSPSPSPTVSPTPTPGLNSSQVNPITQIINVTYKIFKVFINALLSVFKLH